MLSAEEIVESKEKPAPELPTFGAKDFEPNESVEQSHQIEHLLGDIRSLISFKKVKSLNILSRAVWRPELNLAEVTHQSGSYWNCLGHRIGQKLYIYPEEALYLLETGAIEIIYNEVSISVQRAYFILFDRDNSINIARYRVYSLLKSHGYNVLRHSSKNTVTKYEKKIELHKVGIKLKNYKHITSTGKREAETNQLLETNKKLKISKTMKFPIATGDDDDDTGCGGCSDIEEANSHSSQFLIEKEKKMTFDYDLYIDALNKHSFKKSCLQLPSFRVIINRSEDPMPDLSELCNLSSKFEDEIPVIHAVVFCDYIAFYTINSMTLPDLNDRDYCD